MNNINNNEFNHNKQELPTIGDAIKVLDLISSEVINIIYGVECLSDTVVYGTENWSAKQYFAAMNMIDVSIHRIVRSVCKSKSVLNAIHENNIKSKRNTAVRLEEIEL